MVFVEEETLGWVNYTSGAWNATPVKPPPFLEW